MTVFLKINKISSFKDDKIIIDVYDIAFTFLK